MVYVGDLKSPVRKDVWVQVPLDAPILIYHGFKFKSYARVAERTIATDCKSVPTRHVGSNPTTSTKFCRCDGMVDMVDSKSIA